MASVITLIILTISAPDRTTISRRAVTLPVIRPAKVAQGLLHVLTDITSLQVYRAGQWLEAQHDAKSRRKRCKLHSAVDAFSGMNSARFSKSEPQFDAYSHWRYQSPSSGGGCFSQSS